MINLPWHDKLHEWQPFKIDALGLVTLLGAEEINQSIGRLVPSRFLEYFPLLGAFVIAGERYKEKRPSFNLYNITDGINTADFSFWLTRWMTEQDFQLTRSVVHFEVPDQPLKWRKWHIVSGLLSLAFTGFLVAMTILIGDWYGFANALAMIISIVTRAYAMIAHRNAIDRAVWKAITDKDGNLLEKKKHPNKKCLMVLADSRCITLYIPGNLIVPVFVYNPQPSQTAIYELSRYIGWAAFAVHILTIGMATLLPQIYTVALMVIPTVLITWKLGCDDSKWTEKFNGMFRHQPEKAADYECWIGTRLRAYVSEWPVEVEFDEIKDPKSPRGARWVRQPADKVIPADKRSNRRQDLYAWLNMDLNEEKSMAKWDLLPHKRSINKFWWRTYQEKKALIAGHPYLNADRVLLSPTSPIATAPADAKPGAVVSTQPLPRINTNVTSNGTAIPNTISTITNGTAATGAAITAEPDSIRPRRQSVVTVNGVPVRAGSISSVGFAPPGRARTWHPAGIANGVETDRTWLTSGGNIADQTLVVPDDGGAPVWKDRDELDDDLDEDEEDEVESD